MKFGQLIEYIIRNIFPEKSYKKCGGETSPRPKLSISLDQLFKALNKFVFLVYQVEDYQNIFKLSCKPLAFTSYKAFLKNKNISRNSLPTSFSA